MTNSSPSDFPLRLGPLELFARTRSALSSAGFNESNLCGILQLTALSELGRLKRDAVDLRGTGNELAALVQLFLFGESLALSDAERALPSAHLEAFYGLDLLRRNPSGEGTVASPVFLYPVSGFLIASDRQTIPNHSAEGLPEDSVFAALFPGTLRFLKILPHRPVGEVLDLCSGTGIGALQLSSDARRVVATDLTARSVHFSRFNALLNECQNLEAAQGDLYAAVSGQTFDVITAHPPYVPSLGDHAVYRDGGDTGETVVRRIVEGLPNTLRPGGTFYSMSVGLDTKEGRFEERVRRWLGPAGGQFDVVFAYGDEKSPDQAVADIVSRARHVKTLDAVRLKETYDELGAQRLVYGALVIHRRVAGGGTPWTARPTMGVDTAGSDFDWLFAWRGRCAEPGFIGGLATSRPALSPNLQVKATHVVANGALVPAEFALEAIRPFETTTKVDPWVVPLIAQFNGRQSVEELHRTARSGEEIPAGFTVFDFAKLVAMLVERGCLALAANELLAGPPD